MRKSNENVRNIRVIKVLIILHDYAAIFSEMTQLLLIHPTAVEAGQESSLVALVVATAVSLASRFRVSGGAGKPTQA